MSTCYPYPTVDMTEYPYGYQYANLTDKMVAIRHDQAHEEDQPLAWWLAHKIWCRWNSDSGDDAVSHARDVYLEIALTSIDLAPFRTPPEPVFTDDVLIWLGRESQPGTSPRLFLRQFRRQLDQHINQVFAEEELEPSPENNQLRQEVRLILSTELLLCRCLQARTMAWQMSDMPSLAQRSKRLSRIADQLQSEINQTYSWELFNPICDA